MHDLNRPTKDRRSSSLHPHCENASDKFVEKKAAVTGSLKTWLITQPGPNGQI
jgi:hypothetical protein